LKRRSRNARDSYLEKLALVKKGVEGEGGGKGEKEEDGFKSERQEAAQAVLARSAQQKRIEREEDGGKEERSTTSLGKKGG
jgi:hypothetical protein